MSLSVGTIVKLNGAKHGCDASLFDSELVHFSLCIRSNRFLGNDVWYLQLESECMVIINDFISSRPIPISNIACQWVCYISLFQYMMSYL